MDNVQNCDSYINVHTIVTDLQILFISYVWRTDAIVMRPCGRYQPSSYYLIYNSIKIRQYDSNRMEVWQIALP
jgi:hypothetical protein